MVRLAGQRAQAFFDPQVGEVLTRDAGLVVDGHKFDYPLAAGLIEGRPKVGIKRDSGVRRRGPMTNLERTIDGLRPSFSAQVRFGEPGAPVRVPAQWFWGGSVRLKRPMRPMCGSMRLKRPLGGMCALSALCAIRVRFHRFFMPEVQNSSRSPTIYSRGGCPARSDLRFD